MHNDFLGFLQSSCHSGLGLFLAASISTGSSCRWAMKTTFTHPIPHIYTVQKGRNTIWKQVTFFDTSIQVSNKILGSCSSLSAFLDTTDLPCMVLQYFPWKWTNMHYMGWVDTWSFKGLSTDVSQNNVPLPKKHWTWLILDDFNGKLVGF